MKVSLKEGAQKRRSTPIHVQEQVAKALRRLIENGYLARATEIIEDCFVSPEIIGKKDKLFKKALD